MSQPQHLTRSQFLGEAFSYKPGEHLSLISPTGSGKTHFAYQLLEQAMWQNPELSVVSLMPKPADPTTEDYAHKLNLRIIDDWPPRKKLLQDDPDGYVLWPKHARNLPPDERNERIGATLRKGLDAQYWSGDSITFCDDAHSAAVLMKLNPYLETTWINGRAGGSALWAATQKPSGTLGTGSVSSFMYSATTHLFLAKDNDERNIKRFGEIGGINPRLIEDIVRNLRIMNVNGHNVSEQLYIDMRGPYFAIIEPY